MSNSTNGENPGYLAFHRPRFEFLMKLVEAEAPPAARILDIGPSPFTSMLRASSRAPVDSLGLEPEADSPTGHHYHFNLNDTQHQEKWRRDLGPYDVVVFAEVMEHLFTAPELVLAYVHTLLVPHGTLILQTPNAASLRKRIKLALGRNPFERIRPDASNPGHFREYTARELNQILRDAGFAMRKSTSEFYFDARFARHEIGNERPRLLRGTVVNAIYRALPPFLQEGITMVAERA
jgi:SAM-dependent methyltransferase